MKADIHPKYYQEAQVVCACGNTFVTGSTKTKLTVEVCHQCHPIYTGEKRYIDTLGQVDKFEKRKTTADSLKKARPKKQKKQEKTQEQPKTLKELLLEM